MRRDISIDFVQFRCQNEACRKVHPIVCFLLCPNSALATFREEKAKNSSEMPYKHLPEQIQERFRLGGSIGLTVDGGFVGSCSCFVFHVIQNGCI